MQRKLCANIFPFQIQEFGDTSNSQFFNQSFVPRFQSKFQLFYLNWNKTMKTDGF